MENDKRSVLEKINPSNYRFSTKISLLALILLTLVVAFYSVIGMKSFREALIKNASNNLDELSYVKSMEVSAKLNELERRILGFTRSEELRYTAQELTSSFNAITSDRGDLLYGDELRNVKSKLATYYQEQVLVNAPLTGKDVEQFTPSNDHGLLAQYFYMVLNTKSYHNKEKFIQSDDGSSYAMAHAQKHRYLSAACKSLNAQDIYLIDPKTGNVVYSKQKNIDFGINLYKGIYKDSKLSEAFHGALASERVELHVGEYFNYMPASDKPVMLVSIPVYYNNYLVTVLVLQYGVELLDNILVSEYMLTSSSSLEYNIIGQDLALWNNPRKYLMNSNSYVNNLLHKANKREKLSIAQYRKLGSMALMSVYPYSSKQELYKGEHSLITDYKGDKVLCSSSEIKIGSQSMLFIAQIEYAEILGAFYKKASFYILSAALFIVILILLVRGISKRFSKRLKNLSDSITLLYKGEKADKLKSGSEDELGQAITSYNAMRKRLLNAEEFALELSEGNYKYKFDVLSEEDSLGKSLNVLKDRLIQSKEEQDARTKEDEIRNWINSGIAKFNDLLRENNDNIKELAYSIIKNLVEYVQANVGGVYMIEGEKESDKRIELLAAYAYDRRKYEQRTIQIGEGLLGASYQEKKSVFLKQIPDDYIEIGSGLGSQVPSCLYIVPLVVDGNVLGIIEIASFNDISEHHKELIDNLADSIAATFIGVRLNMRTVSLLEESNRRAEEITQQEEEMRQNLEEMQATQEELARLRQDDEKKTNEMQLRVDNTRATLKNLIDAIPGGYSLKDQNGVIHLINSEGAEYYGLTVDRVAGKTDHELLTSKQYEVEHSRDLETLDKGIIKYTETIELDKKPVEYQVMKKTFMMPELGQNGILTIRNVITKK